MSKREDEYYRQNYYGGHPPACTCVKCTQKRLAGLKHERGSDKNWLYTLMVVCLVSTGFIAAGLLGQRLDMAAGIVIAVVALSVFFYSLARLKNPWGSFRSGLLALIIAVVTLLVSLAG
ncbi:MAG: hypothetical protein JW954_07070 [Dehalococcoidaceae bacterium]|nr:hypothetical protein [Dehalococcoidaceae bacterium]